jgi:homopolymeric O-antigen transport system permease protein
MNRAPQSNLSKAVEDIVQGVGSTHVWPMLAWQEIRQRYRRSFLGPFWLTISTGALIAGMGPLYAMLFGWDFAQYVPYLAVSYVIWLFLSSLINDSCMAFISAEGLIKQIRMPLSTHVMRTVWRNLLVFFHNALIIVLTLVFYPPPFGWHMLLLPAAVFLVALNGVWMGLLLGMLCARFRDIPQIVQSVVQIAFFLTPVVWRSESLGRHAYTTNWNPLNHLLEIVRAPLIGHPEPLLSWMVVGVQTVLGTAVAVALFARYRARIAYWV